MPFALDELISGEGVTLRVTDISGETPQVVVIETTEHWSRCNLKAGTTINLVQRGEKWLFEDEHLPVEDRFPWMIITIQPDGSKTMCHYR